MRFQKLNTDSGAAYEDERHLNIEMTTPFSQETGVVTSKKEGMIVSNKRIAEKMGWLPILLLLLSAVGVLIFTVFITFLWFATDNNPNWRRIAVNGWVTQSVALTSVVLRTSVGLQAGIATSMIAGIALESSVILLPNLATVSTMRNQGTSPHSMLQYLFWGIFRPGSKPWRSYIIFFLTISLTITTLLLQFTSTLLISDIGSGSVPGPEASMSAIQLGTSSVSVSRWSVDPKNYPTFAEYAESSPSNRQEGISDTGLVMRSFLPISEENIRSSIHRYKGPARVLDSRVVCIRPHISNIGPQLRQARNENTQIHIITGEVSIPEGFSAHPLNSRGGTRLFVNESVAFSCQLPTASLGGAAGYSYMTFCQLRDAAAVLVPEWYENSDPIADAEAVDGGVRLGDHSETDIALRNYLAITVTDNYGDYTTLVDYINASIPGLSYRDNNEWREIYRESLDEYPALGSIGFSLCLPSFSMKQFNASASASTAHAEPWFTHSDLEAQLSYADISRQLVYDPEITPSERGILSLEKLDWWENSRGGDLLMGDYWKMLYATRISNAYNETNTSADYSIQFGPTPYEDAISLPYLVVHVMIDVLDSGGTIAHALQSLLFTVAASEWNAETWASSSWRPSQVFTNFTQSLFATTQIPTGSTRGFTAVMTILSLHCILVGLVCTWFCKEAHVSSLWNSWQTIAQVTAPVTTKYLNDGTLTKDSTIEKWIKADGLNKTPVIIALDKGSMKTEVQVARLRTPRGTENSWEESI